MAIVVLVPYENNRRWSTEGYVSFVNRGDCLLDDQSKQPTRAGVHGHDCPQGGARGDACPPGFLCDILAPGYLEKILNPKFRETSAVRMPDLLTLYMCRYVSAAVRFAPPGLVLLLRHQQFTSRVYLNCDCQPEQ